MMIDNGKTTALSIHNLTLTVRVPNTVKDELYEVAEDRWCSVSDIVRSGIRQQIQEHKEKTNSQRPRQWSI